ncbi:MAG: hypothetical protein U1E98_06300 [Moraxella osloensis]
MSTIQERGYVKVENKRLFAEKWEVISSRQTQQLSAFDGLYFYRRAGRKPR